MSGSRPAEPAPRPSACSYLYVPGDRERFLGAARTRGADAVIVDLEDAVAPARKPAARELTRAWLDRQAPGPDEIWVRIDPASAAADVELAAAPGVRGVVLPKASPAAVSELDGLLDELERTAGRAEPVPVIALVESAAGLQSAAAIAARPRIARLGIGRADLFAELGLDADRLAAAQLSALWLPVVLASAAAGIEAPIAPVETRLGDPDGLAATTREFAALGFRARTAIHPAQVDVINEVLTPTPEQVEQARERVAWFDAAVATGSGAVLGPDGTMVDEAVIRSAREVLRRARPAPDTGFSG